MAILKVKDDEILIRIFVQPRSSKNEMVGTRDGAFKIRLTAPPVDGAANKACSEFLAKYFGVSKSSVSIESGETSRTKQVCIKADKSKIEEIKNKLNEFLKSA
ncbi:DUF167 domain-containing protein [Desulforegula conservatrix]|uniref:DUF167 domain-containing protein n=1 Tax=Desulforegula conservatrix TaxID=153026 RepID=UPI0004290ADC|nr:DUF167 family protein [Desulforegula conservatrix]